MRRLADFPAKLIGSFLLVVTLLAGTGLVTVRTLAQESVNRDAALRDYSEDLILAERLKGSAERTVSTFRAYIITNDPEYLTAWRSAELALDGTLAQLHQAVHSARGNQLLAQVDVAAADYRRAAHRLVEPEPRRELESEFEAEVVPRRDALDDRIDAMIAHKRDIMQRGYEAERLEAARLVRYSLLGLVAAVAFSSAFAWVVGRQLSAAYRREREALSASKQAIAARQELLGIVAHDLRSPLTVITMKAAMVQRTAEDAKAREHAKSIERIARRTEDVIKSLLDSASIETGKFSVMPTANEVAPLFEETVETLGTLAASKEIHLETRIVSPGLRVLADRERALQVLSNLLTNALKFTPSGGHVALAAEPTDGMVLFTVADDGIGIAAGDLSHVFERFWKAEAGGKKGSGLGLYIAKGIVEAHGGRIWAESRQGTGTKFSFTLRRAEPLLIDRTAPAYNPEQDTAH